MMVVVALEASVTKPPQCAVTSRETLCALSDADDPGLVDVHDHQCHV